MKMKNLLPLVVILAILAVLVVIKVAKQEQPTIVDVVELTALVPDGTAAADVTQFTLFAGGSPDDTVTIARDADDPDVWRVTSEFNAPAQTEKIEEFVKKLVDLKGEFRDEVAGDEGLADYSLTDDQAFHVQGFVKGAAEPTFEVLVGKAPAESQVLARAAGSNEVVVVNANLRREAGIWQDDSGEAPKADSWLDKKVVEIDKDKVTKYEAVTPDKHIVFEKREKPAPEKETPEPAEGEDAAPAEEPTVEYEWVIAQGGPGIPHKQSALDTILGALNPLNATSVVDPATKAEWGLEPAAFTITVAVDGQDDPVVLKAGRPDPSGDGYVRVAGAKEDVVYKLSKWQFERIIPRGKELFALPAVPAAKDAITRVEITQPEGRVVLAKVDDAWTVEEPKVDLEIQNNAVDTVAQTLGAWMPADYADQKADTGLDAPARQAVFTADGQTYTVAIGADSGDIDGAYATVQGLNAVGVMAQGDVDRVFVDPKDLYQRGLFDFTESDITSVTIAKGGATAALAKTGDVWTLTLLDGECEADADTVDDVLRAIADLQAADIRFGQAALEGEPFATVTFTAKGGEPQTLTIGPKDGDVHPLAVSGMAVVFTADALDVEELTPDGESLKKPEPAPAEAPAAEAPVAEAPVAEAPVAEAAPVAATPEAKPEGS
ncbi:MAG: DUF4340 domain-containing protein [bacterium]|nr:DUF4340 domain-containing protein [bacterium]